MIYTGKEELAPFFGIKLAESTMPWILQILGLQKNNLTFTDTEGNVVKMVKPEPKWVKALKNPINAFKKKKADFLKNNR